MTPEEMADAWERLKKGDLAAAELVESVTVDGKLTAEATRMLLDAWERQEQARLDMRARVAGYDDWPAFLRAFEADLTPRMLAVYDWIVG